MIKKETIQVPKEIHTFLCDHCGKPTKLESTNGMHSTPDLSRGADYFGFGFTTFYRHCGGFSQFDKYCTDEDIQKFTNTTPTKEINPMHLCYSCYTELSPKFIKAIKEIINDNKR